MRDICIRPRDGCACFAYHIPQGLFRRPEFELFNFFAFFENIYYINVYFLHFQKVEISKNKKPTDFLKKADVLTRELSIVNKGAFLILRQNKVALALS